MSPIRGDNFDFNTQQDAPEILHAILDELKGLSPIADSIISSTVRSSTTCETCFGVSVTEEKLNMLHLRPKRHITSSFDAFLQPEALTGDNMFFCPQCSALRDSCKETSILYCGKVYYLRFWRLLTGAKMSKVLCQTLLMVFIILVPII